MSVPALVWTVVGLTTTAVVAAMLIGLVRHLLVLVRALGRFRDEVQPVADEIAAQGGRAAGRSAGVGERPLGRS